MSGRYLLDTNEIIALFAAEAEVVRRIENADEILVPVIALGELRYGAARSARAAENLLRIREFELGVTVLPVTARTSEHYGFVKTQLHAKGRPIPENDIWIASLALEHGLTLVTRDTEHFQQVEPLVTERW